MSARLVIIAVLSVLSCGARAQGFADFYRGKTIEIVIGSDPGGAYDVYTRILSRYFGKYIPGNPGFVIQHMPGAGSVIATNHVYNVAPQDGTVILAPNRTAALAPVLGQPGARFDPARINWLGSLNSDVGVMQVWGSAPARTLADARNMDIVAGSTAPLTDSEEYPTLLNNTIGTRFRIVRGYKSIGALQTALERGEVLAMENSFDGMVDHFPDWRNRLRVLVQLALTRHPDMPDIPLVFDLIKSGLHADGVSAAEAEQLWRLILSQQALGRPFAVGPGVSPDRVAVLRDAFISMTGDADFRAELARARLDLRPLDGSYSQKMIAEVAAAPPSLIAKLRDMIVYKGP